MTETTTTRPARHTFADLTHADALVDEHAKLYRPWVDPLDWPKAEAWMKRRDELVAHRNAELAKVRHLLCSRCDGTGNTGWLHRHGGVCYRCNGHGWSARGRRAGAR